MEVFDELIVVKRSGQRVSFNGAKIAIAIKGAFDSVYLTDNEKNINKIYESVLLYIEKNYTGRKTINVEDIQDIIENKLKEHKFIDVYTSFNEYRSKRAESRKAFSIKQQHKFVKAVERIATTSATRQENNLKPMDMLLDFGKTVSCEFTKAYVLDNKSVRAHEEGNIYIHDLDYFNLGMLHSTHLKINESYLIDNFPYNFSLLCLDLKEEIDGEISITSLDKKLTKWLVEKYKCIFKDKLYNYLNLEGILEYINYPKLEKVISTQSNILYNEKIFELFIVNDKTREIFNIAYKDTFKQLEKELDESIKYFLITLNNNHKENKKYSISIGINNTYESNYIMKRIIKVINDLDYLKNVMLIIKTKDMDINIISELIINGKNIGLNNEASETKEVEYFSNGKRIFENINALENNSNGRMVVATTSINLSRLGFEYQSMDQFYERLDSILELTKNQLLLVFEKIGDKNKDNYRMLFRDNILDDEKLEDNQKIRKIIKNGVLNVGIVGLRECLLNINDSKDLGIEILKHMNKVIERFSNETKLNFTLTETSKRKPLKELMALDKTIYGINKNITDNYYYQRIDSLFDYKDINDIKYISKYQKLLNGGSNFEYKISTKTSLKKVNEIVSSVIDCDVNFIKICGGDNVGN